MFERPAPFPADSLKADKFIELVQKYTDFSELTPTMIHEFIEKIVVHEADKSNGERSQKVDIYLNFIGKFEVPIPEPTADQSRRLLAELTAQGTSAALKNPTESAPHSTKDEGENGATAQG